MTAVPEDLRYTKDHEWLRTLDEARNRAYVGITDYAQRQLGDVVYVELPNPGDRFEATEPFGSVESVKAVTEAYMPVSGTIIAVSEAIGDSPELVNDDPYGEGWLIEIRLSDPAQLDGLLSAAEYDAYIREEEPE